MNGVAFAKGIPRITKNLRYFLIVLIVTVPEVDQIGKWLKPTAWNRGLPPF